ncbi:MAG: ATP-binding cassette domain-containing protein, partial [Actinophytocola sp.]|nr:ATP-binding cassette domain-containing protein [Actinophytocola sp.]
AVATEHAHRSLLARWLPTLDLAYLLPVAAVLAIGGVAYRADLAGLGDITAVTLYLLAMSGPLVELLAWVEELQVGSVGLRRILGVRLARPARDGARVTPNGRDIQLRDVRFAYRDGHDVLHGIDLHIAAGERLMVIGPSGSGKSTLARLLAGLAEPREGTISLGGVDLRRWPHDQVRGEVLLLTQEHHAFVARRAPARRPRRRRGGRLGAVVAGRPGHPPRHGRGVGATGGGAAARAGPGVAGRPAGRRAGRGDGGDGQRRGAAGRALGRRGLRRQDGHLHRAPARPRPRRRPHPRARRRPRRRARHPRRAGGRGRVVRAAAGGVVAGPRRAPQPGVPRFPGQVISASEPAKSAAVGDHGT